MTNLDDLKTAWQNQNVPELQLAKSHLQRSVLYGALEAVAWLALVIAMGGFLANHAKNLALAISAAALGVYAVAMLGALIRRAYNASQIDYTGPIVAIQDRVQKLRMERIRTTKYGVLFGTLLWVPALAVSLEAILGVDIYRVVSPAWLIANAVFGLALFPASIWLSRKYGDHSPVLGRLVDDLAGRNLNTAREALGRLSEFQR